jgi:hypothetical protein
LLLPPASNSVQEKAMRKMQVAAAFGALLLGGASGVHGQVFDPQQLPAINGKVAQYTLTPRGDVDGLILQDGTQVLLPPHLSSQLVYAVKPGDSVTVQGLKAMALPLVSALSVTNDATGQTVAEGGAPRGPRGPGASGETMQAQGRVKMALHGRRGEINGVLLDNGTVVRVPPPEAERLALILAPGQTIYASGEGQAGPLGKVIAARTLGPSQDQAQLLAAPRPQ